MKALFGKICELTLADMSHTNNSSPETQSNRTTGSPPIIKPKSSTPVGAIAGGTVGGVVALVAVAGLLFFLRSRKNRKPQTQAPEEGFGKAELPGDVRKAAVEPDGSVNKSELPSPHGISELPEGQSHAQTMIYEMEAPDPNVHKEQQSFARKPLQNIED